MNIYRRVIDTRILPKPPGQRGRPGNRVMLTLECGHEQNKPASAASFTNALCQICSQLPQPEYRGAESQCEKRVYPESGAKSLAKSRNMHVWCCEVCQKWHVGSAPGSLENKMRELMKEGKR